jgi:hypothetical protein
VCAAAHHRLPPTPGRPWSLPLAARMLLVLIHLHTHLTTRALAALSHTSQSTFDRIIHHLVAGTGRCSATRTRRQQPPVDHRRHPSSRCTIGRSPPSARTTAAASTPRSSSAPTNARLLPSADTGPATATTSSWPATPSPTSLDGHVLLGDGGYRGITSINTPRRNHTPAAQSTTTATGHTAASEPASNTSSPGSRTGKYCGNAAAEATPSTTASTSPPDSGTSRTTSNYGSPLSEGSKR